MPRKGETLTNAKMDDVKEDTSKHGQRPEKLFTDMYMPPPIRKQKESAVKLLLI